MTIQEALRTGKPFKRKGWDTFNTGSPMPYFSREALLSDDWEVEQAPITLTKQQFCFAWAEAQKEVEIRSRVMDRRYTAPSEICELLLRAFFP